MIRNFLDDSFLEEDMTVILPPSKQKSNKYSPCSRKNKKCKFVTTDEYPDSEGGGGAAGGVYKVSTIN